MADEWKLPLAKLVGTEWLVAGIIVIIVIGLIIWWVEKKVSQYND